MLGRWQPWHSGHLALFERCLAKTGQVIIQVRDVQGWEDNPFEKDRVFDMIEEGLTDSGYTRGVEYEIMFVPNVVNITYGRKVGYAIEQETFDEATHAVSATEIRQKMREEGTL